MSSENEIIKWCDNCSRTFNCIWPSEGVCKLWAPDLETSKIINQKKMKGEMATDK